MRCNIDIRLPLLALLLSSAVDPALSEAQDRSFGEDVQFLRKHVQTIVLGDPTTGPAVAVVPGYQARVMTSTATGNRGNSFGWINYKHIKSGKNSPHINVYGGEERFWLGPEGGQFSIFFKSGAKFDLDAWQTPPVIDTAAYRVDRVTDQMVNFSYETKITNYSSAIFDIRINRDVELLSQDEIRDTFNLQGELPPAVGYRTTNCLTNRGTEGWSKETGLLSIWLLGMYKHGPETTVVIPYRNGDQQDRGPIVVDDYFGKVPPDRLKVADGVIYFSGDGQYRSKIGLSPKRATPICGSYDAARKALTIVTYNQPGPKVTEYVNSKWEVQDEPYAGDAINSYNDGPPEPGADPLGPFYELETSSPALALQSGETGTHLQTTVHFEGNAEQLDQLARKLLGVSLEKISAALR